MFACIVSATALLKCCGQAEPSTRDVTVVSVITAAACDMRSPMSHISLMCS